MKSCRIENYFMQILCLFHPLSHSVHRVLRIILPQWGWDLIVCLLQFFFQEDLFRTKFWLKEKIHNEDRNLYNETKTFSWHNLSNFLGILKLNETFVLCSMPAFKTILDIRWNSPRQPLFYSIAEFLAYLGHRDVSSECYRIVGLELKETLGIVN